MFRQEVLSVTSGVRKKLTYTAADKITVTLQNNSDTVFYIGDSNVDATTFGAKLVTPSATATVMPNAIAFDLNNTDNIWVFQNSGATKNLNVIYSNGNLV